MRHSFSRQAFTLLEMLVAVAIASFVVAGLYGLFIMQSRQFMFQDMQMEMHQNLRFGTDMLTRSIRMAGFNTNGYVNGMMGSDGTTGTTVDSDQLQAVISWDGDGPSGTDAITVVYGDPSTAMSTDYNVLESCSTKTLSFQPRLGDNPAKLQQFSAGDLLLCYDYASIGESEAYLWSVSAIDTLNGTLTVPNLNTGSYNDYDTACPSTENLSPIMRCAKGQVLTFYIDDTDDATGPGSEDHPVLMMDMNFNWPNDDDVPLVDNIEDLQFEYCLESAMGLYDCDNSTQWKDSFPMARVEDLWSVRIHMIVRSSRDDPGGRYTAKRPNIANRSGSTTADGYYRQVLTTEVSIRNLRML